MPFDATGFDPHDRDHDERGQPERAVLVSVLVCVWVAALSWVLAMLAVAIVA